MEDGIIYRRLSKFDSIGLLELRNEKDVFKWLINNTTVSLNEHKKWFDKLINNSNDITMVAEFDFKVIGFLHLQKIEASIFELHFRVHPEFQGQGVAQKLFDLTLNNNQNISDKTLVAKVKPNNSKSINFFLRNNFEMYREIELIKFSKEF
jgi:ribosomal protein S18 acetylase RimI-like enzyme